MIVEPVMMFAAAMKDATHGVNAQIAALTTAGAWGTSPAPPNVSIVTPYDDLRAAVGDAPAAYPAISVFCAGVEQLDPYGPFGGGRDGVVTIAARYDSVDPTATRLQRNAGFTMRAALRSIHWLCAESPDAARLLNGIQILNASHLTLGDIEVDSDTNPITLAALCKVQIRDALP